MSTVKKKKKGNGLDENDEQRALLQKEKFENGTTTNSSSSSSSSSSLLAFSNNTRSSCDFAPTQTMPNHHSKPVWIPAYPGSGSTITQALVRAVTGRGGNDFYTQKCPQHTTATCKTHWPTVVGHRRNKTPKSFLHSMHLRYILLVRNPIRSLPSFFNYKWEKSQKQKGTKTRKRKTVTHQQQAPQEEWRKHRDETFDKDIQSWYNLLLFWRDQPYELAFVMPYEHLTSNDKGPATFQKLVEELRLAGHDDNVVPSNVVACLWYRVVKEQKVMSGDATIKRTQKYIPRFTQHQTSVILAMLQQVANEFPELKELMAEYAEQVRNLPIDHHQSHHNVVAVNNQSGIVDKQ